MKVLIVDDSKAMRMIVKRTLMKTDVGKCDVVRRQSGAQVIEKQQDIGVANACFGLGAHASRKGLGRRFLETGGVHDLETQIKQRRVMQPTVAGHSGLVIDKGDLLPGKPVEQRRLADIRSADDGGKKRHGTISFPMSRRRVP